MKLLSFVMSKELMLINSLLNIAFLFFMGVIFMLAAPIAFKSKPKVISSITINHRHFQSFCTAFDVRNPFLPPICTLHNINRRSDSVCKQPIDGVFLCASTYPISLQLGLWSSELAGLLSKSDYMLQYQINTEPALEVAS